MKNFKSSALFALACVPPAALGAYFTILYQLDFMDAETLSTTMEQFGSTGAIIAVYIVQIVIYTLVCGFFGHLLAQKLSLMAPVRFQKVPLIRTLSLALGAGILFSLDYWTFGAVLPRFQVETAATLQWHIVLASILYGGIVEELMLRLFMMSLIAYLLWKLFFRREKDAPTFVIIAANIIAAILFAAGHLPAIAMLFGELTPLLLLRCFLLNGGFGLLFGWLYRKQGIQYAMVCHAGVHIVSKLIWFLFI